MTNPDMADAMIDARRLLQLRSRPATAAAAPRAPVPKQDFTIPASGKAMPRLERRRTASIAAGPMIYGFVCMLLTLAGVAGVWQANRSFAPEMYAEEGMLPAVEAFSKGLNYAVFDLNLNIRKLRDFHIASFTETPDVMILGASHWQEAHGELVKGLKFYNAHIHRDYWEDMLGMAEILERHGRMPKRLIISVRDNLFTPMSKRKDFLWEPGIPYYRAFAPKIGVEMESFWASLPYQRLRERVSISMLFTNLTRWYNTEAHPHESAESHFEKLDGLLPDGSITWSTEHMAFFSQERSKRESLAFAEKRRNSPPMVEERGLAAFEKLLDFLKAKGVTVYFVQPPFNPIYYDHVQGSPYAEGLAKFDAMTRSLAARHGIDVIGGFDPRKVGCNETQYIDAEHANPTCLQNIFNEFSALDRAKGGA